MGYSNFVDTWAVLAGAAVTIALGGTFLAEGLAQVVELDRDRMGKKTVALSSLLYLVTVWALPAWVFFSAVWRLQAGEGAANSPAFCLDTQGASVSLFLAGLVLAVIAVVRGIAGVMRVLDN